MNQDSIDNYLVLGNPVAHSQSPFIHAEFARQTGQALAYGRELCALEGFDAALQAFAERGGRGCNVTVPFKFRACALAVRRSERAELAQAANVLKREAGGWSGDNTDGVGLLRDIEHNAGVALARRRVLLIGAGGAAAGVLGPLLSARPAELVLVNRTLGKAEAMVHRHQRWASRYGAGLEARSLRLAGRAYDVVINASSSSLLRAPVPVDPGVIDRGTLTIDLMYGPAAAPFLAWAQVHGGVPRDGLGMLVEQAAFAFEWWRGVRPDTAPVLAALRARLSGVA